MITITIAGKPYEIKTAFNELDIFEYLEYYEAFNKPVIERVSLYTGIPVDELNKLTVESFVNVAEMVQFIEDTDLLNALAEPFEGKDIGLESYGKVEKTKAIIANGLIKSLPQVVEHYQGEKCPIPLLFAWHKCQFYLKSISAFFDRFKEMNDFEYTDDEIEAGVETLGALKHWSVVFKYGRDRGMTNDEVLNTTAIEVYMELLQAYREREYQKRLSAIRQQRQEHEAKLAQSKK